MTTVQTLLKKASLELTIPNPQDLMRKATGFLGNKTVQTAVATVAVAATAAFIASNPNLLSGANQSTGLMLHPTANPAPTPTAAVKSAGLLQELQAHFDAKAITIVDPVRTPLEGITNLGTSTTQTPLNASSFPLEGIINLGTSTTQTTSVNSSFPFEWFLIGTETTMDALATATSKTYSGLEHLSIGAGMLFSKIGSVVGGALSAAQELVDTNPCPRLKRALNSSGSLSPKRQAQANREFQINLCVD